MTREDDEARCESREFERELDVLAEPLPGPSVETEPSEDDWADGMALSPVIERLIDAIDYHLQAEIDDIRDHVARVLLRCAEPVTAEDAARIGTDTTATICLHDLPCPVHPRAARSLKIMATIAEERDR